MRYLHGGMHAGIRASCRNDLDRMIRHLCDRSFYGRLNPMGMRLRLPAGKDAAVIFDAKGDAGHGKKKKAVGTRL